MKFIAHIMMALLFTAVPTLTHAKPVKTPKLYIFGFSASFNDSTVYITGLQELKEVWIDSKTKFLISRDSYSYQLKDYLTQKLNEHTRVCLVIFDVKQKKAEKKFQKMKTKYIDKGKGTYDVRLLTEADFKFEAVDEYSDN